MIIANEIVYFLALTIYNVNMVDIKISKNLKQLMKDSKISQSRLAQEIKVSQSAISAWLSEKKEPSITSLWLLADYFSCSVDELIGRENL